MYVYNSISTGCYDSYKRLQLSKCSGQQLCDLLVYVPNLIWTEDTKELSVVKEKAPNLNIIFER